MSRFFVGITGASGHRYAEALVRELVRGGHAVDLSITEAGAKVLKHELGIDAGALGERLQGALDGWLGAEVAARVRAFPAGAIEAPPSSGTALTGAVILAPCSMGTMARVAAGFSSNLVERVADVALKEGRTLVLVPRETPLSEIHLENMLRLARMGAVILPAMPGFYHRPETLDDLVAHVVGKILDRIGVEHSVGARWQGLPRPAEDAGTQPPEATP
ncbi:MAG: UbiX family flavin prenyltransferase [Planctomycetota bacterium]|nr:MAG: UbiX family flavin prenyltransferase [Planctomycetota bacterium]